MARGGKDLLLRWEFQVFKKKGRYHDVFDQEKIKIQEKKKENKLLTKKKKKRK